MHDRDNMSETKTEWRVVWKRDGAPERQYAALDLTDATEHDRNNRRVTYLGRLRYSRIEKRTVTPWSPVEDECKK